jgi:hypothetical protein
MLTFSLRPRGRAARRAALASAVVVLGGLALTGGTASAHAQTAAPAVVKPVLMRQKCASMGTDRQGTAPIYDEAIHCAKLWLIPGKIPTFYAQNEIYCRRVTPAKVTFPACGSIEERPVLAFKKPGSSVVTLVQGAQGICGIHPHAACPAKAITHVSPHHSFSPFTQEVWAVSFADRVVLAVSGVVLRSTANVASPHVTAKDLA